MAVVTAFSFLAMTLLFKSSSSSSTLLQAELIFPRNNSVYQPEKAFPIVFALHNFSTAWNFKPTVTWVLTSVDVDTGERYAHGDGWIGWNLRTESNWTSPPDMFVAANYSTAPGFTNESVWRLEYTFALGTEVCSGKGTTIWNGMIFFNTSKTNGKVPDLSTTGSCAPSIGAIGIEGFDAQNQSCMIMSAPQPKPSACAITVDTSTAGQIGRMINRSYGRTTTSSSYCTHTKMSWPNMTILGKADVYNECPEKSGSRSNFLLNSSGVIFLSLLITIFMWKN